MRDDWMSALGFDQHSPSGGARVGPASTLRVLAPSGSLAGPAGGECDAARGPLPSVWKCRPGVGDEIRMGKWSGRAWLLGVRDSFLHAWLTAILDRKHPVNSTAPGRSLHVLQTRWQGHVRRDNGL